MDNFIVSARKYRPVTFKSVVGQSHITSTLKNAISRNQLAHAYLFCGPRGVGKTTCARIFAKAINCLNPQDYEACGECESCRSFNEGRSMNIHELDAASNNRVEDIRSLIEQIRIPPQTGRYSVYIIDEVHMLSQAAFNAFLKTLEEPPAHAIFIMATTEKYKILPTILSRCQIFDFNRIRVEDSVEYLKYIADQEGITYDDESLHMISRKADGGMRDALSMFDKAVSFCGNNLNFKDVAETLNVLDYDTYFNITSMITAGDYKQCLIGFDQVLKKGFSGQTFIAGLNNHFRDLLMCKDPQTMPLLEATGSLLERYKKQAAELDAGFLFESISLLSTTDATLKTATNQRLHIELALMKLCGIGQKKNFNDTIELPPLQKNTDNITITSNNVRKINSSQTSQTSGISTIESEAKKAVQGEIQNTVSKKQPLTPIQQNEKVSSKSSETIDDTSERSGENDSFNQSEKKIENRSSVPSTSNVSGVGNGSIFGVSIKNILNTGPIGAKNEQKTENQLIQDVDPECEQKIMAVKQAFLEKLNGLRPRIANALQDMTVKKNKICSTVCSDLIYNEIMSNRREILDVLQQLTNITGPIDFEIKIKPIDTRQNPITIEDKYAYLIARNPALTELQKRLNLELD